MQHKELEKNTLSKQPVDWEKFQEKMAEKNDPFIWQRLVEAHVTAKKFDDEAYQNHTLVQQKYKELFQDFWMQGRPRIKRLASKKLGLLEAANRGYDVYLANKLSIAKKKLSPEKFKQLLDMEDKGFTALHYAIKKNHLLAVETLLEFGADPNFQNSKANFQSPLHVAAQFNCELIAKLLLKAGANDELDDRVGDKAIHIAALNNAYGVALVLLEHNKNTIHLSGRNSVSPLCRAIVQNNIGLIKLFIQHGANLNEIDPGSGHSMLQKIISKDNPEFVQMFFDNEVDINFGADTNLPLLTALQYAVTLNPPSFKAAKKLIELGANVNVGEATGNTPLALAVYSAQPQTDRTLIFVRELINNPNCDVHGIADLVTDLHKLHLQRKRQFA